MAGPWFLGNGLYSRKGVSGLLPRSKLLAVSLKAVDSKSVALIRSEVPEFEPHFQELLADWDEVGPFQVVSAFARWLIEVPDEAVLRRGFAAIDRMAADNEFRDDGWDLSVEFFETVEQEIRWRQPSRIARLLGRKPDHSLCERIAPYAGPHMTEWFQRYASGA